MNQRLGEIVQGPKCAGKQEDVSLDGIDAEKNEQDSAYHERDRNRSQADQKIPEPGSRLIFETASDELEYGLLEIHCATRPRRFRFPAIMNPTSSTETRSGLTTPMNSPL